MQKLTIEINSKNGNFINSIDEIKKQIEKGFIEGFNEDKEENYNFKIT